MDKEQIKIIREWFERENEDRSIFSYYYAGEYSVAGRDVEDFGDYFYEHFPDCIGIECMVGNNGIWFWDSSLEKVHFI